MSTTPGILLINLDRSPDRLAFIARQLGDLGLDFTRLPATDASTISDAEFARLGNTYMRPISRSELACLISHTRVWQFCVEENRPILVLEDDVILSDRLPAFLKEFSSLKTADIVNIETRGAEKWVSRKAVVSAPESGVQLYRLYVDRGGSAGYIVLPEAARALLKRARHHAAPSDAFLNLAGIARLQAEPGLAAPLYDGGEDGGSLKVPFKSTITQPSKMSRLTVLVRYPHFKLRRLAGHMAMTARKLGTTGVGVKRKIAVCPTILAHANNWSV
ncbi:glycosyltransferase family 25 protein [Mesorhizobium sp. CGMCC 1.15528]|uniref:Glycosyltransferase family 25 protein n=1 Tax=Mesorhizobium zhangyense TaxID=1776730 RepID=A0A7C9R7H2_9HYPH|nr:glycosyltransferase family 25 protein [Mesorhizobium zhangyense]NGN42017.1 glycosyltransferase family 25 protein [Mesorhizobium zhangyense]